jgi:hypothetical protein
MRVRELFESDSTAQLKAQILTVLDFLRNRDHNKKLLPKHTTLSVINMVNNAMGGEILTYELLDQMKSNNSEIGGLITNMDRNTISLKPFGDEPGAPQEPTDAEGGGGNAKDPTAIVNKMAQRAASNRQ